MRIDALFRLDIDALADELTSLASARGLFLSLLVDGALVRSSHPEGDLSDLTPGHYAQQVIPAAALSSVALVKMQQSLLVDRSSLQALPGISLVVATSLQPVALQLLSNSAHNLLVALSLYVAILVALFVIARMLVRPMELIASNVCDLRGAVPPSELRWPSSRIVEIHSLVDQFLIFLRTLEQNQKRLHDAEARQRKLAELGSDWVWETDSQHRFTYFSQPINQVHGAHAQSSAIGKRRFDAEGVDLSDPAWQAHLDDLHNRREFKGFVYSIRSGAETRAIRTSGVPQFDETGEFRGYLGVASDITELYQARLTADAKVAELSHLIERANVPIFGLDRRGRIFEWNDMCEKITGMSKNDVLSCSIVDEFIPENHRKRFNQVIAETMAGDEALDFEVDLFNRKRQETSLLVNTSALFDETGNVRGMLCIGLDITERKRNESAIREQRDFAENLIEAADSLIAILDTSDNIVKFNQFTHQISGYSLEECLGKSWAKTFFSHPDSELVARTLREVSSGAGDHGHVIPLQAKNGRQLTVHWKFTLLDDAENRSQGILVIGNDITELRQAEEVARRTQKMAAVGQLSGGIAHDFNNILGIIIGNGDLLRETLQGDPKSLQRCNNIMISAERGSKLVRQLLVFSGKESKEPRNCDLNALLEEMQDIITRALTSRIEVIRKFSTSLNPTYIDPGDFQDAVLNMTINAAHAMPEGGQVILETANRTLSASELGAQPYWTNEFVCFRITDTGVGISKSDQERIFEPFFTTKAPGKGTGLGLAMVFSFVERAGGTIRVDSEPGHGTTFEILLPRASDDRPAVADVHQLVRDQGDRNLPPALTIMAVDDERELLEIAAAALRDRGYRVITAHNGPEVLEMLTDRADVDLLFTDVVMPGGLNGLELAERARQLHPQLKVLLTSGHVDSKAKHGADSALLEHLLQKPYRITELLDRVKATLEGDRAGQPPG
ncbi:MAG TPA: PAS domain S-box protein [Gammaproteobacteria bacterium]